MSAPKTTSNGQLVTRQDQQLAEQKNEENLVALVYKMSGEMEKVLPRHITPERMARIAVTALRTTKHLAECSSSSFLGCVLTSAQLGLEPNTPLGQCYLIPRRSKGGGYECTLLIGYQGMLDLIRRSGEVSSVFAHAVYEGDKFEWRLGLSPDIRHIPTTAADRVKGQITHVYAVARIKEGDPVFVVLSRDQVEARRKRGGTREASPWDTDFEAMALKTAIRALWKWVPKNVAVANRIASAMAVDEDERGEEATRTWSDEVVGVLGSGE